MAKSIKLTGDANSGLGKFSVFESTGEVDETKEVFDENIPITEKYDHTVDVAASAVDVLFDIAAAGVTAKKVLIKCAGPLQVKFNSSGATVLTLSGITVIGGQISQLYVSNPGSSILSIRVLAGG